MCAQMRRKDPLYTKVNSSQYDWARVQEVLVVDAITWNHSSINGNIHTLVCVEPTSMPAAGARRAALPVCSVPRQHAPDARDLAGGGQQRAAAELPVSTTVL